MFSIVKHASYKISTMGKHVLPCMAHMGVVLNQTAFFSASYGITALSRHENLNIDFFLFLEHSYILFSSS